MKEILPPKNCRQFAVKGRKAIEDAQDASKAGRWR